VTNWSELTAGWLQGLLAHKAALLLLGGALGTYARYGVGHWLRGATLAHGFPYGTLAVNVAGSFLLGVAAVAIPAVVTHRKLAPEYNNLLLLVGTGFCGGFTTFSTFELETLNLIRAGSWRLAVLYVAGSVTAGFGAVFLAVWLAQRLCHRPPG
jgi:CrcB protein